VSLASLARYRRSLGDFVRTLPMRLEEAGSRRSVAADVAVEPAPAAAEVAVEPPRPERESGLRAIEGGLA
jgi:hypothetical protein